MQEQIAGDELWPASPQARIATGFNRHYPDESNAAILMQRRQEVLLDITDTVGSVFMGLTYGCAKCHDHKFDPILQADYYRLQAFFSNVTADDEVHLLTEAERAERARQQAAWEEATARIREQMDELLETKRADAFETQVNRRAPETQEAFRKDPSERTMYERLLFQKHIWQMRYHNDARLANSLKGEAKERYRELEAELASFDHLKPAELPLGMGIKELGPVAPKTHILSFANYAAPQDEVEPGFLTLLDPQPAAYEPALDGRSSGRRTALAKWLTDPANPSHGAGHGQPALALPLRAGNRPHAQRFRADGRAPDASRAARLAGRRIRPRRLEPQAHAPRHHEFGRLPAGFRLPGGRFPGRPLETACSGASRPSGSKAKSSGTRCSRFSGRLNHRVGGPSAYPALPDGAAPPRGGWDVPESAHAQDRRSVYVFVRRNSRYPMLESFDMPDTHESCARRSTTTTAPQALALLNSEHTLGWAQAMAGPRPRGSWRRPRPSDRVRLPDCVLEGARRLGEGHAANVFSRPSAASLPSASRRARPFSCRILPLTP